MIQGAGFGVKIDLEKLPIIDVALGFAAMGMVPGGAHKNRSYRSSMVDMDANTDPALQDIIYDPQTSGGLCIAVEPTSAEAMVEHLQGEGVEHAAIIGEVVDYPAGRIQIV
jgi:selenide,water dikinase